MRGFPNGARFRVRALSLAAALGVAALISAGAPAANAATTAKITNLDPQEVFDIGDDLVYVSGVDLKLVQAITVDGVDVGELTDEGDGTYSFFTPPHAVGKAEVRLITADGTSADNGTVDDLNYIVPPPPPVIISVTPNCGPLAGGNTVTIKGSGLKDSIGVVFGTYKLGDDLTVVSDNELTVVAPNLGIAGTVNLRVLNAGGTNTDTAADDYTFAVNCPEQPKAPTISSLSPKTGAPGTVVTINGTDLTGATVKFGDTPAALVTPVSATQLKATAPGGTGTVNVIATTAGGPSANTVNDDYTYPVVVPAPTVISLSPTSGETTGGTPVTITGKNLANTLSVSFDGVAATSLTNVSDTQVTVKAPAHAAGKADVVVTTASGPSANTGADDFNYFVPAPSVTSISPATGVVGGGTVVTINGLNLAGTTGVKFDGVAGTSLTNVSNTQIKITSPAHAAGKADVVVTTAGGNSAAGGTGDDFTYFVPAPVVSSISPASGLISGGTIVTITGQNLSGTTAVTFGGTAGASVTNVSDTQVKVTSPAKAVGKADIVVTTPGGLSANSLADDFVYVYPPPAVTSITPDTGLTTGGTVVTINGQNLSTATGAKFGSNAGTSFSVVSDTQVKVTSPAGAAGKVDVIVTSLGGASLNSSSDDFTYTVPAPIIDSITPGSGAAGSVLTITGQNLAGASVKIAGADATVAPVSATQLKVTAPATGTGTVDVVVTTPGGTATGKFTFVIPAPSVTGISPATGVPAGGTVVTINGQNLTGASVKFGSLAAASVTPVSATQIKATSPAASAGKVDVIVTTAGGTSANTSADDFTYAEIVIPAPTVTGISPNNGPEAGGTSVTITGTNLTNASGVKFGSVAGTSFQAVSATQVKATSPAGTGTVDVTVTTPGGTTANVSSDKFTYNAVVVLTPTISALTPSTGAPAGGNSVTLTGTNLSGATGVKFGANAATNLIQVSDTQVKVTAPAGELGSVDVTVTTPNGTSAPATYKYSNVSPLLPQVRRITPNFGISYIGGVTTIQGLNFKGVIDVKFGTKSASWFVSGNTIVAVAPALRKGVYAVTVRTVFGTSVATTASRYTYYGF